MSAVRAVVFDCDGVLLESRDANLSYYNAILAHFGAAPVDPADEQALSLCHTAASPEVLKVLLGESRKAEALAYAATLDYRQFIPYLKLEPYLRETLEALSAQYPLAVATNRGTSAQELLRHFDLHDLFATVVTSRDVCRPKPWPDMLIEAARRLECSPEEMLFVGDSHLDLQAARGAGAYFVAYKGQLEGERQVASHLELLEFVRSQFTGL